MNGVGKRDEELHLALGAGVADQRGVPWKEVEHPAGARR